MGAKIISIVFHPLFIPVYISLFLLYYTPLFPQFTEENKLLLLLRFLIMYTVFPLVTILLAKGLGFVQSIYLRTQKDRIIPYVACGIYYFWMWYVLRNQPEFPRQLVMLSMSIFIAASLGLIFNSYLKISMHSIAVGVMAAFIYCIALLSDANIGIYISLTFLIAGAVGTARLVNADHYPVEVYGGFFIGICSLLFAYWIVM
jgi:membrane-associated phospholipid phosphatase